MVSICQIGLYLFCDKMSWKYGRAIILVLVLIGYVFIIPPFFFNIPDPGPNEIKCGMPVLGMTLFFWFIGGGTAILVHFLGKLIRIESKESAPPEVLDYQGKI